MEEVSDGGKMESMTNDQKAQAWRERIALQRASGQSVRGWCRQNGHREYTFYWWQSKLGLSPSAGRKRSERRSGQTAFAEVIVKRAAGERSGLPSRGTILAFPAAMPVDRIAQLVRAIEGKA